MARAGTAPYHLYLLFRDIAPQSRLERYWAPTLGAVFGFCLAMYADMPIAVHWRATAFLNCAVGATSLYYRALVTATGGRQKH